MIKNVLRTSLYLFASLAFLCLVLILVYGGLFFWNRTQWPQKHFTEKFREGCSPSEYYVRYAGGGDTSYAFLFGAIESCQTIDFIKRNWQLSEQNTTPGKKTFIDFDPPGWWPTPREREAMTSYGKTDDQNETYALMWIDEKEDKIYATRGWW